MKINKQYFLLILVIMIYSVIFSVPVIFDEFYYDTSITTLDNGTADILDDKTDFWAAISNDTECSISQNSGNIQITATGSTYPNCYLFTKNPGFINIFERPVKIIISNISISYSAGISDYWKQKIYFTINSEKKDVWGTSNCITLSLTGEKRYKLSYKIGINNSEPETVNVLENIDLSSGNPIKKIEITLDENCYIIKAYDFYNKQLGSTESGSWSDTGNGFDFEDWPNAGECYLGIGCKIIGGTDADWLQTRIGTVTVELAPYIARANNDWLPANYNNTYITEKSFLDFSDLIPRHANAGERGFMKINENGKFEFADGSPAPRFACMNIVMSPGARYFLDNTNEIAEYARQIRRGGFNMVRMHFLDAFIMTTNHLDDDMDGEIDEDHEFGNSELLVFDRMIYEFKKNGIYLFLDLATSKHAFYGGYQWGEYDEDVKLWMYFSNEVKTHWSKGINQILNHQSSIDGIKMNNEPAIAIMQIHNENRVYFLDKINEVKPFFQDWCIAAYAAITDLNSAWGVNLSSFDEIAIIDTDITADTAKGKDLQRFILDAEKKLAMYTFNEVRKAGAKVPVVMWNSGCNAVSDISRDYMPVVDIHTYHDHPSDLFNCNSLIKNYSSFDGDRPLDFIKNALARRYKGRPLIISEYGFFAGWSSYAYEEGLAMPAYCSFGDIDMISPFCENIGTSDGYEGVINDFKRRGNPVASLNDKMAMMLYLRGDVSRAIYNIEFTNSEEITLGPAWTQLRWGGIHYNARESVLLSRVCQSLGRNGLDDILEEFSNNTISVLDNGTAFTGDDLAGFWGEIKQLNSTINETQGNITFNADSTITAGIADCYIYTKSSESANLDFFNDTINIKLRGFTNSCQYGLAAAWARQHICMIGSQEGKNTWAANDAVWMKIEDGKKLFIKYKTNSSASDSSAISLLSENIDDNPVITGYDFSLNIYGYNLIIYYRQDNAAKIKTYGAQWKTVNSDLLEKDWGDTTFREFSLNIGAKQAQAGIKDKVTVKIDKLEITRGAMKNIHESPNLVYSCADDISIDTVKNNLGLLDNATSKSAGIYQSDTGQIFLDKNKKIITVNTPDSEGAAVPAGQIVAVNNLTMENHGRGGISVLVSVENTDWDVDDAYILYLMINSDTLNTGESFDTYERKTLLEKGTAPALVRRIKAVISIKTARIDRIYHDLLPVTSGGVLLSGEKITGIENNGYLQWTIDTALFSQVPHLFKIYHHN
ncbi:MAG: hypothetical protein A2096_13420 [Spirochaetes bacterium GWF1_41_5]|nr:MAG: hypothetical protein A2096_13420 [Spirochaetes bacterium GWF1_41_5]